ncbi:MAG: AraC family transcriptional regulator ligand-binding domain-containing protein [Sphingomonadales bacterium]|nr:AraC family transcriptional regulator ligand-binding domain-containing protein [Sphingomonadales bacterium]
MTIDAVSGAEFEAIHAPVLRFFPDLVAELGGTSAALLAVAGIDPGVVTQQSPRATYRQLVQLLEHSATVLHCPDFGMRLAARQEGGGLFGPLGEAMRNSRTFGEALEYVRDHIYAHSLAARVWLWPNAEADEVFSGHDILIDGTPNKAQAMEQLLLAGHLAAIELTGGRARAKRVYFRHQPVSSLRSYRRYFGCEVRFGQNQDGVVFSQAALDSPVMAPDPYALERVTAQIERQFTRQRPPLHAETRGAIMRLVGLDDSSNARVAAIIGLHPRTLHRRLLAEGTSYQQVKDEVRRDIALYYLERTELDFTRISERLGFAEQSVMTRACNKWFGKSPTRLRLEARGARQPRT